MIYLTQRLFLVLAWCSLCFSVAAARNSGIRGLGIGLDIPDTDAPVDDSTDAPVDDSTDAPADDSTDAPASLATVAASDDDLSTLVELVTLVDLGSALEMSGPFTIFAPTNEAFKQVIENDNYEALDLEVTKDIISYHIVPGKYLASDLSDGQELETLQGEIITVGISDEGVVTVDGVVISTTDMIASNGVIHTIDGVLFPASLRPGTIVEVAASSDELSLLVQLVTLTGLGDALSTDQKITVFAPTNAAISARLPDDFSTLDVNALTSILTYHVVPGEFKASDLTDGMVLKTIEGGNITIGLGDTPTVNGEVISQTDIMASNGVVHLIDDILFPDPPVVDAPGTLAEVGAAIPELSTLMELISEAGLSAALATPGLGPFTVFAPTNAAIAGRIPDTFDPASLPEGVLPQILSYHVVAGELLSSDLSDGQELTTLSNDTLVINISDDGVVTVNNEVISQVDIVASNGVVHMIDDMLFPP